MAAAAVEMESNPPLDVPSQRLWHLPSEPPAWHAINDRPPAEVVGRHLHEVALRQ